MELSKAAQFVGEKWRDNEMYIFRCKEILEKLRFWEFIARARYQMWYSCLLVEKRLLEDIWCKLEG